MPKTTFTYDTIVPPEWFNATQNLRFVVEPQNDGEYSLITNAQLSDAAGQIKPEWVGFRDAMRVSAATGLNMTYTGGICTLETGLTQTIAPDTLSLPASSTSYVFINSSGAIVTSTILPTRWCPLASVVTTANSISSITDLRERFKISPIARLVQVFGGSGSEGDWIINTNATIIGSAIRFVRNFTVAAGVTLTITGGVLNVEASGTVDMQGAIVVSPIVAAGSGFAGSIGSPFYFPGEAGTGNGRASGHNTAPKASYPYRRFDASSSSGGSGSVVFNGTATCDMGTAQGGPGGGGVFIRAAGSITIGGTITANGGNATPPSITNVTGTGFIFATGAPGGTGGTVELSSATSITVLASATISVRGGNSSAPLRANTTTTGMDGTGASSGGYLAFFAPLTITSMLQQLSMLQAALAD
jgi:hypothetical protein